ncbi:MAG: hypothetical protein CBB67_002495 [Alteromonadaceae bacterium TMED7]|nr:MAG: hypothetical protein CBB67_002495 [Alteromonadaceae bacterium TMED7]|tara:strand:- start:24445 stop:25524 length:1080 start_codon:yes stop_codon:yes gene_type:complete
MKSDKSLILHIGCHKTGTTAIQQYLMRNQESLNEIGWHSFFIRPDGTPSPRGNANIWVDFQGKGEEFSATVNKALYKALSKQNCNTILSMEELSWLDNKEQIAELQGELSKIFSNIQVVCYVRRQDQHLLSHYQQSFKGPHSSARSFYGSELCIMPKYKAHFDKYLNYAEKLGLWADVFGKQNIHVREFARNKLHNGDAVADFMHYFLPDHTFSPDQTRPTNESFNCVQSIICHYIREQREELWYELGRTGFTNRATFAYPVTPKFNQQQSVELMSNYFEANVKLKEYLPDLSPEWTDLALLKKQTEKYIDGGEFTKADYEASLSAIIKFYDELTISRFIKIKWSRFKESIGFKRQLRF